LILWLHDLNYNFFSIGALTYAEINSLVSAWNRREKKKEQNMKKGGKKSKFHK